MVTWQGHHLELPDGLRFTDDTKITLQVDQGNVGKLLGKSGRCIHDIEKETWAWIQVDQSTQEEGYSTVRLQGQWRYQLQACDTIAAKLAEHDPDGFTGLSFTADSKIVLQVDQKYVPYILGRQGAAIKTLETQSWAWIKIDQSTKGDGYSTVRLDGKWDYQRKACQMIADRVNEAKNTSDPNAVTVVRLRSCSPVPSPERSRSPVPRATSMIALQARPRSRSPRRWTAGSSSRSASCARTIDSSRSRLSCSSAGSCEERASSRSQARSQSHRSASLHRRASPSPDATSPENGSTRRPKLGLQPAGDDAAGRKLREALQRQRAKYMAAKNAPPVPEAPHVAKMMSVMQEYEADESCKGKHRKPPSRMRSFSNDSEECKETLVENRFIAKSKETQPPPPGRLPHVLRESGAAVALSWPGHWLDGQVGCIAARVGHVTASVRLSPAFFDITVQVPTSAIQPLQPGCLAEVSPAAKPPGNTKTGGRIADFVVDNGEYNLRVPKCPDGSGLVEADWSTSSVMGRTLVSARPAQLVPHRLLDMPFTVDGIVGAGAEHRCRFVDSSGKIHKFIFYVPPSFKITDKQRWPLLLFLHGSQGGTVVGSRLKAKSANKELRWAPGADFASERFVMLCPKCEWKWDGKPQRWVLELVKFFQPASWCNTRRIYCTGLSMGGMGVWELCSISGGLFTAVAPVGAYHRKDFRERIARGLKNTPIYVVSSPTDKRCPMAQEVELWSELRKLGNRPVVKQNVPGGHGELWKVAYAKDTELWKWFLRQ